MKQPIKMSTTGGRMDDFDEYDDDQGRFGKTGGNDLYKTANTYFNPASLKSKLINYEGMIKELSGDMNKHKTDLESLKAEKEALNAMMKNGVQDLRDSLRTEMRRMTEDLHNFFNGQKLEHQRLQKQISSLKNDKTEQQKQLIANDRINKGLCSPPTKHQTTRQNNLFTNASQMSSANAHNTSNYATGGVTDHSSNRTARSSPLNVNIMSLSPEKYRELKNIQENKPLVISHNAVSNRNSVAPTQLPSLNGTPAATQSHLARSQLVDIDPTTTVRSVGGSFEQGNTISRSMIDFKRPPRGQNNMSRSIDRGPTIAKLDSLEEELQHERETNLALRERMKALHAELEQLYNTERENLINYYEKQIAEIRAELGARQGIEEEQTKAAGFARMQSNETEKWFTKGFLLGTEVDRLNDIMFQLFQELGIWKQKCQTSEAESVRLHSQLEAMKKTPSPANTDEIIMLQQQVHTANKKSLELNEQLQRVQNERDSAISQLNAIRTEKNVSAGEKDNYESQMRSMRIKMSELERVILEGDRVKLQLTEAQRELEALRSKAAVTGGSLDDNRRLRSSVTELEIKVGTLTAENRRQSLEAGDLKLVVAQLETEAATLRQKLQEAQVATTKYDSSLQIRLDDITQQNISIRDKLHDSERVNSQLTQENERLKVKLGMEKEALEGQIKRSRRASELEIKVSSLEVENTRLKNEYQAVRIENEGLTQEIMAREAEIREQMEGLRRSFVEGSERIKFEAEKVNFEAQMLHIKQRFVDLENKLKVTQSENERLKSNAEEKGKENDVLAARVRELEIGHFKELEELKLQLDAYKKNNLDARELSLRFGGEKANFEHQSRQLRQMLEGTQFELTKMNELFSVMKNENERLKDEQENLRREVFALGNERNQLANENLSKNDRIQLLMKDLDQMKLARDSYQKEIDKNGQELARKQQELTQRLADIDQLQKRYEEVIRNSATLTSRDVSPLRSGVPPSLGPSAAMGGLSKPGLQTSSINSQFQYRYGSTGGNPPPTLGGATNIAGGPRLSGEIMNPLGTMSMNPGGINHSQNIGSKPPIQSYVS